MPGKCTHTLETAPFFIFFIILIIGYLGTIPFGPVNLSVAKTCIDRSFRSAFMFSLAAAIVEIPQSYVALAFGPRVSQLIERSVLSNILVVAVFFILGLIFFLRKPSQQEKAHGGRRDFVRGFFLAMMNPQAIPFWVLVLTYLKSSQHIELTTHMATQVVLAFFLGVAGGKLLALLTYAHLSQIIVRRASFISLWMNKIIGSILIGLGLIQGIKAVFLS